MDEWIADCTGATHRIRQRSRSVLVVLRSEVGITDRSEERGAYLPICLWFLHKLQCLYVLHHGLTVVAGSGLRVAFLGEVGDSAVDCIGLLHLWRLMGKRVIGWQESWNQPADSPAMRRVMTASAWRRSSDGTGVIGDVGGRNDQPSVASSSNTKHEPLSATSPSVRGA